eukprot:1461802-Rhodomonas_salina.1
MKRLADGAAAWPYHDHVMVASAGAGEQRYKCRGNFSRFSAPSPSPPPWHRVEPLSDVTTYPRDHSYNCPAVEVDLP